MSQTKSRNFKSISVTADLHRLARIHAANTGEAISAVVERAVLKEIQRHDESQEGAYNKRT